MTLLQEAWISGFYKPYSKQCKNHFAIPFAGNCGFETGLQSIRLTNCIALLQYSAIQSMKRNTMRTAAKANNRFSAMQLADQHFICPQKAERKLPGTQRRFKRYSDLREFD